MKIAHKLLTLIFILFAVANVNGQNATVQINGSSVDFNPNINNWFSKNIASAQQKPSLVLLHMNKILSTGELQKIEKAQITLQEYIGNNTYAAWISANSDLSSLLFINGIAELLPNYKIAASIQQKAAIQKNISVFISFYKPISLQQIQEVAAALSATIIPQNWQKKGLYKFVIGSKNLNALAAFYGTKYISEATQNVALDVDSKGAQAASILNMPNILGGKSLRGKGTSIGHGDNCSGIYHIDQSDRTINYNNGGIAEHGVLVHGIIGGDGIIDPAAQGIATEGTCISLFYDAVLLLKDELYKGFKTTLTNNSYAALTGDCAYAGQYDLLSQNLDDWAFTLPEQLDVFAAGNDGRMTCGGFATGFHTICGGFQTAKNVLTVGATARDLVLADFSSKGPINDGRIKPEISAVGKNIICPIPPNTYKFESGTSLSCPQVTGVLALLSERYKQLHSGLNIKSDLLKAIAINGASDLGNPGPDFKYGFGFLNGIRSIEMIEKNQFNRNVMPSGAPAQSFTISVPSNTAQLKVLLYYHDPSASASSSTQLVNDLDLTVAEPGGALHRPLVLNPSVATVNNNAIEGLDRINNVEQVTINKPSAGTYNVSVSDFAIPKGPQEYVVVYDIIPDSLKLLYPIAHCSAAANTDMYIYWDAPADAVNTTLLEYSTDNGATWSTIASSIAPNIRYYNWAVPNIGSNQCKIRISRAGKTDMSGAFMINQQATVFLSTDQCPGSIAAQWTNVASATKYYMLLKKGAHLEKIDSVNAGVLNYTFKALNPNNNYWVAVMPAIGSMDGYRSKAIMATPNTGTCATAANGDLAISEIIAPVSGRRFTKSALKSNETIKIQIRNQDDEAVSDFSVSYQINAGIWKTISGFSIAGNSQKTIDVDSFDFRDTIVYKINVAVKNNDIADPIIANDSLSKTIKHIANDSVILLSPLLNDFENIANLTLLKDSIGLSEDGYWDYENSNDTGRLRTRIPGSKLVKTTGSISMDLNMNAKSNANFFTGTFNLALYDSSVDEVRFDFEYEMRGMPILRDSNKVWIRGNDSANWIPVFSYSNIFDTAKLQHSGTISMRDFLRNNNQNFSSSTQIRFGQFDSTVIVDDNYGAGLTIDNVNFYKVLNDLQLTKIIHPEKSSCNISASPLTISLKNGTVNTIKGISMGYILDTNPPVFEAIADSLLGEDSLIFTFTKMLTGLSIGEHQLKVWVHTSGDDYLNNDTISNYYFYNSAEITNYPYLENFESNNGFWYSSGRNASWAYGSPSGTKINKAASGNNIWKTNLNGNYNSNEQSYLYSPCLSTIGMAQPILSFSVAFDIESCVVVCDRVIIEYSIDKEQTWQRLGNNGEGTNWYNNEVHNVWNGTNTRWHVASIKLPIAATLKLRFAMKSDLGTTFEGFALDDIHIFDLQNPIAHFDTENKLESESKSIFENSFIPLLKDTNIIAAINPLGENIANSKATTFQQDKLTDLVNRQYLMPRSFVINNVNNFGSKLLMRLYLKDSELQKVWDDTSCKTCSKPEDIYRTGISQFRAQNELDNDNLLSNNKSSSKQFYSYNNIKWVPYDDGYYAEWEANGVGEYWLNDGGISNTIALNTEYVLLKANKKSETESILNWASEIDSSIKSYQLQVSYDSINFTEVSTIASEKKINIDYNYLHQPNVAIDQKVYYRLYCTAENSKTFYSNIASVLWTKGDDLLSVYPNPFSDGKLYIKWTGAIGLKAQLKLTDVLGRTILSQEIMATNWTNTTMISLGHLFKGVYFLNFNIGQKQYLEKLISK